MSSKYCFQPLGVDGGGVIESITLANGVLIACGDVEGLFRSEDCGDHWIAVNNGNQQKYLYQNACVAWSITETNTVYAGVGNAGASGGFMASTDGGLTWSLRSTAVQFSGNHAASPLPTGGWPRSVGNLIAQDGTYVYAATYNGGVFRSAAVAGEWGTSWTNLGLSGGNYYCRGMAIDAVSKPGSTIIYVATYDWSTTSHGTYGHIWQYDPTLPSPSFVQLTQSPPLVEELKIVGGYLYAVCGCGGNYTVADGANPVNAGNPGGLYRVALSGLGTSTAWTSLNDSTYILPSTAVVTPPYWQAIDGYTTGSGIGTTHTIIIGCTNPLQPSGMPGYRSMVQVTIGNANSTSGYSISYSDLSANINPSLGNPDASQGLAHTINLAIPPDNRLYWRMNSSNYQDWVGGSVFTVSTILIDPTNTQRIYITGTQGFYRSYDGGANWQLAVNGMQLFNARTLQVDPNNPHHLAYCADDFGIITVTDGVGYDINTTSSNPPKGNQEGYTLAYDPVGNTAGSTLYVSLGTKYANTSGDVYHLPAGSSTWVDDQLNLAGNTNPLALDTFNRNVVGGWALTATVSAATAAALPSYTYANGVITATAKAGPLVIDGYTVVARSLILVKNEAGSNQAYNGIYLVNQAGNSNSVFKMTLSSTFDTPSQVPAATVLVSGGSNNNGLTFVCSTPGPSSSITLGTTPITWVQPINNLPINGMWNVAYGLPSVFSTSGGSYNTDSQSVSPGIANIQLPGTGAFEDYIATLSGITALNSSGQVNLNWTVPAAGGTHYGNIILCYTTANPSSIPTYYSLRVEQLAPPTTGTTGTVEITILATYADNSSGTYAQTTVQIGNATLNTGAAGLICLDTVQAATVQALSTYTYNNGTSGVGATLTSTTASGQLTIDSYETLVGDRILIQNEAGSNQAYNGIYTVTDNGANNQPFVLTRSTDFNQASQITNTYTFVENGVANVYLSFNCMATGTVTMGSTAITWAEMAQQYYVPGQTITAQYLIQQITEKGGGYANEIYFSAWTGGAGNQPSSWLLNKTDKTYLGPGGLPGVVGLEAECSSGYTAAAEIQFTDFDISTPSIPSYGPGGKVAIGLLVGRDGNNNRFVLAAVSGSGVWRRLAYGSWILVSTTNNTLADVQATTTAVLPANTYNNGTSGVGATLTASSNAALIIDGYTVLNGDRILVKNQAIQANNGIYVVTNTGSSSAPYVLTRSTDFNTSSQVINAYVYTVNGTTNGGTAFVCSTVNPIVIGTTTITWSYALINSYQISPSSVFAALNSSQQHVYLFDRGSGIYCSTNYGVASSWNLVWSVTASDAFHGYMVINPSGSTSDEVWVSTTSGLYKLTNAANGSVGNGVTLTQISGVSAPGPITITSDGVIYCINLPYTANSVFYPTLLLRSVDGGATWESVGDVGLKRVLTPTSLSVASNGRIYVGTSGNQAVVGYNVGQSQTM
jgi:hypothetical protein